MSKKNEIRTVQEFDATTEKEGRDEELDPLTDDDEEEEWEKDPYCMSYEVKPVRDKVGYTIHIEIGVGQRQRFCMMQKYVADCVQQAQREDTNTLSNLTAEQLEAVMKIRDKNAEEAGETNKNTSGLKKRRAYKFLKSLGKHVEIERMLIENIEYFATYVNSRGEERKMTKQVLYSMDPKQFVEFVSEFCEYFLGLSRVVETEH